MHGTFEANMAMHHADTIFAVGARFDDRVTNDPAKFCPDARVIHLDVDPASISKIIAADVPIVGPADSVLAEMARLVRQGLEHQGYRIDLDFCRGCGLCAQVCVGSALDMVDEDQVRKINPNFQSITIEPHIGEVASRQRFRETPEAGTGSREE